MQEGVSRSSIKQHDLIIMGRIWAPLFIMAGISILSGTAGVQAGKWAFTGIDKLGHLLVFGLLGISWARVFSELRMKRPGRWFYAVTLATVFGLLDELHQLQNPLRTFEWADLLADFCGSLLAVTIYLWINSVRFLLELEMRQFLRLRFNYKNQDS